jgi:hypothetical protein
MEAPQGVTISGNHKIFLGIEKQPGNRLLIRTLSLSKENFLINLLVSTKAGGTREDFIRQIHTIELLRNLIGFCSQINIRKCFRIDCLCNEPGIDQRNFIVGIVGIICLLYQL